MFAKFMALGSLLMVIVSLPISLFFVVKVVQVRELQTQGESLIIQMRTAK